MTVESVVTLDIGGTTIKGARTAVDGRELAGLDLPTPVAAGPAEIVRQVRAVASRLADRTTVAAALAVPGIVDQERGVARQAANLGWREVPLRRLVSADLGLPVTVVQDARAACLAETAVGRARGCADALVVVLGTGVAAGLVSGGRTIEGATGSAGELGHLPVHPDGEACACGQRGCVEVYSSAAGVARRYAAAGGSSAATAQDVVARLGDDPVADRIWAEATRALGLALASATMLLDPALIVLAGGLTGAGEVLLEPVRAATRAALAWRAAPELAISPLGARAGRVGAAILAWRIAGRPEVADTWVGASPQPAR